MESFGAVMQEAVAMKADEDASFRRKFDSLPMWFRNSLFSDDKITELRRSNDFNKKMQAAMAYKEAGKALFLKGRVTDAMHEFDKALGLFKWIECSDENWKQKGIRDEFIKDHQIEAPTQDDKKTMNVLRSQCLTNLAACYQKLESWRDMIFACDATLAIDPSNAKAYYRRAQARTLPKNAGLTEYEFALNDLMIAQRLVPTDTTISKALNETKETVENIRKKEKEAYKGAFGGKKVKFADESSSSATAQPVQANSDEMSEMTIADAYDQMSLIEKRITELRQSGDNEDADVLEERLKRARKAINTYMHAINQQNREANSTGPSHSNYERSTSNQEQSPEKKASSTKQRSNGVPTENTSTSTQGSTESNSTNIDDLPPPGGKEFILNFLQQCDFTRPTPDMLSFAEQRGLDLLDQSVQKILSQIHEEALAYKDKDDFNNLFVSSTLLEQDDVPTNSDAVPTESTSKSNSKNAREKRERFQRERLFVLHQFFTHAIFKLRRIMARPIATKIVDTLLPRCYRNMLLVRRGGAFAVQASVNLKDIYVNIVKEMRREQEQKEKSENNDTNKHENKRNTKKINAFTDISFKRIDAYIRSNEEMFVYVDRDIMNNTKALLNASDADVREMMLSSIIEDLIILENEISDENKQKLTDLRAKKEEVSRKIEECNQRKIQIKSDIKAKSDILFGSMDANNSNTNNSTTAESEKNIETEIENLESELNALLENESSLRAHLKSDLIEETIFINESEKYNERVYYMLIDKYGGYSVVRFTADIQQAVDASNEKLLALLRNDKSQQEHQQAAVVASKGSMSFPFKIAILFGVMFIIIHTYISFTSSSSGTSVWSSPFSRSQPFPPGSKTSSRPSLAARKKKYLGNEF